MIRSKLLLFSVFFLALALRLVWLDQLPIGFTPDETALGYNAFSLLRTGRDEWGTLWWQLPYTNLKSFGDYKPPLYSFLAIPFVYIFGLNEFAVRLPSALIGSLSILTVYLLARKLFTDRVALIASFLIAVSPWSIQMSRIALEANLVTGFLPLALLLYLKRRYTFAAVNFALSFYSYHSARLLTLAIFPLLLLIGPRPRKMAYFSTAIALLLLPGLFSLVGSGSVRGLDVAIFSPTDSWQAVASRRFIARNAGLPDAISRFFSNKLIFVGSSFTKNYLSYISPQFLFTSGAGEPTYGIIPNRGLLYYIELPFLVLAFWLVISRPTKPRILVSGLLLLSILPAAIAKGPGYAANRAAAMLPFLTLLTATGIAYFLDKVSQLKPLFSRICRLIIFVALFANFGFFAEDYFYHSPRALAQGMNHGIRETLSRVRDLSADTKTVTFSRSISEPHIYVAFYWQLDPEIYQRQISQVKDFQSQGYRFLDQYPEFTLESVRFGDLLLDRPGLYVGRPNDFPPGFPQHFQLDYPDGSPAIQVSEISS